MAYTTLKQYNGKVIKPMFLFFDYLYETVEQIGEEVLSDWSHKETPELQYCVMDIEDAGEVEMSTQFVSLYSSEAEAIEELEEEMNF